MCVVCVCVCVCVWGCDFIELGMCVRKCDTEHNTKIDPCYVLSCSILLPGSPNQEIWNNHVTKKWCVCQDRSTLMGNGSACYLYSAYQETSLIFINEIVFWGKVILNS